MPTIGTFKQVDLFGQEGTLETKTFKARVAFVPLKKRHSTQPHFRILEGRKEVGAAWTRTSKTGGDYLFLHLYDPSRPDTIACNLYRKPRGPAVLWAG
jgi:uncharacterized protein (DUF736 family)